VATRLLELIIPASELDNAGPILEGIPKTRRWVQEMADELARITLLLEAESAEELVDQLSLRFASAPGFRMILLPVEATVPKLEESPPAQNAPGRISRHELYEDVAAGARLSPVYLINVALSAVVATIGLLRDDIAVIIGAMVIAPLLGPNVALALAATLGDTRLALRTIRTGMAGVATAVILAVIIGWLAQVDPQTPALLARTHIGLGDIALALAAGTAGTLAFTTGIPAALIGVMVAVALLPPLVTSALLFGSGHLQLAIGATFLYLINVACENLSGIATFLMYGIHPQYWWESDRAKRSMRIAATSWFGLLVVIAMIWWWAAPKLAL
jgi:uncharacterized hydrophobic protein (TIGR00341 family)